MRSTKAKLFMVVFLLPLGPQSQREVRPRVGVPPTGFIDVVMTWSFTDEYKQGRLTEEGLCSTRLELQAGGFVRAEHRYQRTVSRSSWRDEARENRTVHQTIYLNALRLPPLETNPVPSKTTHLYQGNPRLVTHRDGSATLSLQRQTNPVSVVVQDVILRREGGKESDPQEGPWRLSHAVCDPIGALYAALDYWRKGKLGSLPALKGDEDLAVVLREGSGTRYGRGGFPRGATVRATWELKP